MAFVMSEKYVAELLPLLTPDNISKLNVEANIGDVVRVRVEYLIVDQEWKDRLRKVDHDGQEEGNRNCCSNDQCECP